MIKKQNLQNQAGFTIIELMIATSIFSVILIMATVMIVGIGNLYYKGISQTRVQDNVRAISDDVIQHVQLSSSVVSFPTSPAPTTAYCIGTTRYTFAIGTRDPVSSTSPTIPSHVLWRDTIAEGTCSSAPYVPANGEELISPKSRLTAFSISDTHPYTVTIGVAYGDSDLLTNSGDGSDGINTRCLGGIGQQFCATAYSVTTTTKRL